MAVPSELRERMEAYQGMLTRRDNAPEDLKRLTGSIVTAAQREKARIAGVNALSDRDSLKESVMASRSVLSRSMAADPAGHMGEIIASIRGIQVHQ